jgi:hypothetical protein
MMGFFLFATASITAVGLIQPPTQWVSDVLTQEVQRSGCEADRSPPSNAEFKNVWSCTFIPSHGFMAWRLVKSGYNNLLHTISITVGRFKVKLPKTQLWNVPML